MRLSIYGILAVLVEINVEIKAKGCCIFSQISISTFAEKEQLDGRAFLLSHRAITSMC
jgi:hypothetical protein